MSEWRELKLGDIADVRDGTHDSPKQKCDGEFLITSRHIKNGKIDFSTAYRISIEDYESVNIRSKVDKWDVLFSMIGTIGETAIIDFEPNFAIKNIGLFKTGGNRELAKWILYYLMSSEAKAEIDASLKGSTQQYITLGDLRRFPIRVPPLPEQKAIAEVLSTLDDKIDLLHRQNKTLEQMAETLFRQWFVEEAQEDWEYTELGNFVSITNGVSYKSSELKKSNTALVTLKSFSRNGSFRHDGFKEYVGKYKETHIINVGDIAVAHTDITQDAALIGNPVLIENPDKYEILLISMDLVRVNLSNNKISKIFVYFLMRTRCFKEHCIGHSNGSTVLHLSKQAIPSFEFFLPPKKLIDEFSLNAEYLVKKQKRNNTQIRTLENIRDTLLPKLMSGEVRIASNG